MVRLRRGMRFRPADSQVRRSVAGGAEANEVVEIVGVCFVLQQPHRGLVVNVKCPPDFFCRFATSLASLIPFPCFPLSLCPSFPVADCLIPDRLPDVETFLCAEYSVGLALTQKPGDWRSTLFTGAYGARMSRNALPFSPRDTTFDKSLSDNVGGCVKSLGYLCYRKLPVEIEVADSIFGHSRPPRGTKTRSAIPSDIVSARQGCRVGVGIATLTTSYGAGYTPSPSILPSVFTGCFTVFVWHSAFSIFHKPKVVKWRKPCR